MSFHACVLMLVQVDNAATKGASAVLIYPDGEDFKYLATTPLYGHVSLHKLLLFVSCKRSQ